MTSEPPVSFNPGPSQLGAGVADDIAEIVASGLLSMSHRSTPVKDVVLGAVNAMRVAMRIPEDYAIVFQPSATAAMETIVLQCVRRRRLHLVHGAFGQRFAETPGRPDVQPIVVTPGAIPAGAEFPSDTLQLGGEVTDFVAITHNETSTGHMWPEERVRQLRERMHADALLAIDVTSSFGALAMDWSLGDFWFGSVQKCLGLPAGLGYLILSPRALARADELAREREPIAQWRVLPELARSIATGQTVETPNVLGIALLGRTLRRWDLEHVEMRVRANAALVGAAGIGESCVEEPDWRSITVHNLRVDDPNAVYERALAAGYALGRGYGKMREECVRIATFPAHTTEQVEGLIAALS